MPVSPASGENLSIAKELALVFPCNLLCAYRFNSATTPKTESTNLLDTSRSILVSSKQQEGNQYGSGGADYICGFSGTVQDRGTMPGVFIPANEEIIGSIACYGNEIDDLIVNKKFQHKGYGKQLLLWGMQCIRKKNTEPIVLHVAE